MTGEFEFNDELMVEVERIFGPNVDEADCVDRFYLLPFDTEPQFIEWLRTIPAASGPKDSRDGWPCSSTDGMSHLRHDAEQTRFHAQQTPRRIDDDPDFRAAENSLYPCATGSQPPCSVRSRWSSPLRCQLFCWRDRTWVFATLFTAMALLSLYLIMRCIFGGSVTGRHVPPAASRD